MSVRHCDIVILGGGLAGGLVALALKQAQPGLSLLLVEQGDTLGGHHVWSFFGTDIGKAGRDLLDGMIVAAWPEYTVRFPRHERCLRTSYYSITSARFDRVVRASLGSDAIMTGVRALACSATNATLSDGTRVEAGAVIDARGLRNVNDLTGGWQKFVGRRFRLQAPHGLNAPIVKDATVEQIDGYRFVYCLPFAPDEIFVEDTYYADGPALDVNAIRARIDAYVAQQGWIVTEVLDEEQGILPVVAGGDFGAFWRASGSNVARAGVRAGLFHAVTSYSLPDAVRYALALASQADLGGEALARFSEAWAQRHWQESAYYRTLSALLFAGAEPHLRYRVLERFYGLDHRLIERFYAGRTTTLDKFRILAGKPPLPVTRAVGVLTRLGARPKPLSFSGTRP
ncbi:lycopene beta-cyclase CrtY [Novosphingobium sp. ERN07]|uniref:lycopene beta-cyclase CrtY n=1 Tax=Novosphingobium sp. ERN07 TaxID=2726187 RepID=UPI0014568435|nr:lycopene beta-cyclase CrtY [Novosphingobium sp. ERN07]NLR72961.1 lycopene beta-cyclase CrtY [Novosphingobium sp. ERN07]